MQHSARPPSLSEAHPRQRGVPIGSPHGPHSDGDGPASNDPASPWRDPPWNPSTVLDKEREWGGDTLTVTPVAPTVVTPVGVWRYRPSSPNHSAASSAASPLRKPPRSPSQPTSAYPCRLTHAGGGWLHTSPSPPTRANDPLSAPSSPPNPAAAARPRRAREGVSAEMADTQLGGSPPMRPRVTGGDMKNARGRRQAPQRAMDPYSA